ncbi:hypothetical protein F5Y16DRAFT_416535 [Xylariaceae sp. FL0255]|nr:hypothetical protein F5Y16DRAFT_416535 [Xylariaceae sp. FL0255]
MFSNLTTKLAMRKVGLQSDALDFSSSKKFNSKSAGSVPGFDDTEEANGSGLPAWMSIQKLPLTAQAWLSPVPPPVHVASECPKPGDLAPLDRDRQLEFGGGKPVILLFMRCVGCAFAQASFLSLRALATKNQGRLRCIAISHASPAATRKWIDLLGGSWSIEVLIDEDRAIYAAWGLGLGTVWSMFNPTTQIRGFQQKGWLGVKVANAIQQSGVLKREEAAAKESAAGAGPRAGPRRTGTGMSGRGGGRSEGGGLGGVDDDGPVGPSTVMGNKWQQSGLFAVDGRGTVVWSAKALRADDMLDLEAAAAAVGF